MLHYVICDDDSQHLQLMLRALAPRKEPTERRVELATADPTAVLAYAAAAREHAIYFLDLRLDDSQTPAGLALCREVLSLHAKAYVIFVSAYPQYALDCCRSHAFDFLVKPFVEAELSACVEAVAADIIKREGAVPLVASIGSRTLCLDQREILYFSRDRNFVTAHMESSVLHWRESFASLLPRLREGMFFRAHNGFIVNLGYIMEVEGMDSCLKLKNRAIIPYSRRNEKALLTALNSQAR